MCTYIYVCLCACAWGCGRVISMPRFIYLNNIRMKYMLFTSQTLASFSLSNSATNPFHCRKPLASLNKPNYFYLILYRLFWSTDKIKTGCLIIQKYLYITSPNVQSFGKRSLSEKLFDIEITLNNVTFSLVSFACNLSKCQIKHNNATI